MIEGLDDPGPEPDAVTPVRPFVDWGRVVDEGGGLSAARPTPRPFLLTSGRVRTSADAFIALETQVISTQFGYEACSSLAFERRDIVRLCTVPMSVAEIAARLALHLGVVRVLVGDLITEGYVYAYLPNADASQDIDTLLRVIHGLRALS
jgi:hypothetical protein